MSELITKSLTILHPKGHAWTIPAGDYRKLLEGLAIEYDRQKIFTEGVLDESYPPAVTELIQEWFKAFDMVYDPGYTLQEARDIITERWTSVGGQNITYLQDQLDKASFTNVTIYEIVEQRGTDGSFVGEARCGLGKCWKPENLLSGEWFFHYLLVGTVPDRNALFRLFNIVDKICPYHVQALYYVTWDMEFSDRTPGAFDQLLDVQYGYNFWIAVGGSTTASFSKSLNGYVWENETIGSIKRLKAIDYYNFLWMAVGVLGEVITSNDDGENWTQQTSGVSVDLYDVKYINDTWMAVGKSGTIITSIDDGENWTQQTSGTTKRLISIAYDPVNEITCVVGEDGTILISKNFVDWFDFSIITTNNFESIDHNGRDLFVAGGENGMLYKSKNGQFWQSVTYATSNDINKVKYGKYKFQHPNLWAILENVSTNALYTSFDMINFKQQALTTGNNMLGIEYSGKLWVFVGINGTIYNSLA